jgi:cytochrome c5
MPEPAFEPPTELLLGDLQAVIRDEARGAARSQQVAIGPSELGQACERKLALGLLGAPAINDDRDDWTATVGTACHAWMEKAFAGWWRPRSTSAPD